MTLDFLLQRDVQLRTFNVHLGWFLNFSELGQFLAQPFNAPLEGCRPWLETQPPEWNMASHSFHEETMRWGQVRRTQVDWTHPPLSGSRSQRLDDARVQILEQWSDIFPTGDCTTPPFSRPVCDHWADSQSQSLQLNESAEYLPRRRLSDRSWCQSDTRTWRRTRRSRTTWSNRATNSVEWTLSLPEHTAHDLQCWATVSDLLLLLCIVTFPPLCSNVARRDFCSSFRQALVLVSWTRMSHISCICLCWQWSMTVLLAPPTGSGVIYIDRLLVWIRF